MPIQEEEHKCEEFDQMWIFTYGDMVTLLLVFFVLLLTFCKTDTEKFKSVAESFKPTPPGSPFFLSGQPAVLEKLAQEAEKVEIPEENFVSLDDRGVVVSFKDTVLFQSGSAAMGRGQPVRRKARSVARRSGTATWPAPVAAACGRRPAPVFCFGARRTWTVCAWPSASGSRGSTARRAVSARAV